MQILPASDTNTSLGFFGSSASASGFADAMSEALDSVASGDAHSASTALREDDEMRPLVESPYSRSTTDGVTYELSEVCFTKSELAELRQQLLREGAPVESLQQFDILCDQPDGATLAQVLASLLGGKGEVKISEDDEHAITALLNKIDPSGDLAGDALRLMQNGQGQDALELISAKFADLDENIQMDLDEILALGRGLGLNQSALGQIEKSFQGASTVITNGALFRNLMAPASSQFMEEAAAASKLDAALEKTLKPMISKARTRMEKEKEAASLESRKIQLARLQIDNTVQKNSRETMEATLAGEETAAQKAGMFGAESFAEGAANAGQSRRNAQNTQNAQNAREGQIGQPLDGARAAQADPKQAAGQNAAGQNFTGQDFGGQNGEAKKESAWTDLLGKLETKPAPARASAANSIVYSMLQNEAPVSQTIAQEPVAQVPQTPQMSRQMAAQVEQGLLTAMRDGATRMDLQLHPAELGTVAITLIARNGEVSAQIRSEKGETAEMLTRQLDAIRVSLEQQGLKVDKLEVAMQNQDNQDNQNSAGWQDLAEHNARQEQHARQAQFTRMRNLASLRNNGENAANNVLEQSLHIMGDTAINAGRALNVVA